MFARVVVALLLAGGIFALAERYFTGLEMRRAEARVTLYRNTLTSALDRFDHLPFVLSLDAVVRGGAQGRGLAALDRRLAAFAERADLDAIYLMDRRGDTVAASNFDAPGSFVGQNYAFRPYFRAAMAGERGAFFGIGSTTGLPGYFVSEPVREEGSAVIGVVALKLTLAPLVEAWSRGWAEGGEAVLVSNADGVVVLSSEPAWLYRTLAPLDAARRGAIRARRQFAGQSLAPLDWRAGADGTATVGDTRYLHAMLPAGHLGWTVHYLAGRGRAIERAALSAILAGLLLTGLLTYAMAARSRRVREALSASQAARKALQSANTQLRAAQRTLARTSRLAALGQVAASVTHELGQPITALRNYVSAAEMGGDPPPLAQQAGRIAARMENITRQLKFFATKGEEEPQERVDLRDVVRGALMLTRPDFEEDGVTLETDMPPQAVAVAGARLRLEQVLVNLLRNARLAALDGEGAPGVAVRLHAGDGRATLSVHDSGRGFEGEAAALFEPFRTSRPSGEGMGLGLSISHAIAADHGGTLGAVNHPAGGAVFTLALPLCGTGSRDGTGAQE